MARMMVDPEKKRKAYELAKEQAREYEEFIAEPKEKRYRRFDSGIFNSITKGYMLAALQDAGVSKKKIEESISSLNYLLDTLSAEDAEAKWLNG